MTQAMPYTRTTGFADDERNNAGGRAAVRTANVDAELDAIAQSLNPTIANLAKLQRDDGVMRDGCVPVTALGADTLKLLQTGSSTIRGAWTTGTAYALKDLVIQSGNTYMCAVAHTSGTFNTDLAAVKWILFQIGANPSAAAIAFTPSANITSSFVQAALAEVDNNSRQRDADFASTTDAAKGAGALGFSYSLAYGAGTTGKWLKDLANSGGAAYIGFIQATAGAILRDVQSKARETLSVKDFGAIGDGASHPLSGITSWNGTNTTGFTLLQWQSLPGLSHVTSISNEADWVAAQAAVNTGKAVYWPDGSYIHDQPLSVSTYNQRLFGSGRLATITFILAAAGYGIVLSGANGRQQVFGLNLVGSTNCSAPISSTSPQIQVFFNWITPSAAGSDGIRLEDENLLSAPQKFCFGAMIGFNFIHGSSTVGSRGIRVGLNSQQGQIFTNVIDNFETGIALQRNTDTFLIEGNTIENIMASGHGIDMRSIASTSVYQAVVIRGNHLEDLYSAICWGTTGGTGATYTSCDFSSNKFVGHAGGTNYFLTILGTCGAGSANNRVEYNDAQDNLTFFFNIADQAGGQSLVSTKGNTVAAGKFATGTYASSAYTIREHNPYFHATLASGTWLTAPTVTRSEESATTFRMFLRWDTHEYLESVQFRYLIASGTPTVTCNLHQVNVDTDTILATSGSVGASGIVKLTVETIAQPLYHYYLEFICTTGDSYVYPAQAWIRG